MQQRSRWRRHTLAALSLLLLLCYGYRYVQPIEVVDVIKSNRGYYDYIVIKNPPLFKRDFIRWWQDNKTSIEAQYNIPSIDDGIFTIGVWVLPKQGYDVDRNGEHKGLLGIYEQMCIEELPQAERCIEKERRYANIGRAQDGWYYVFFADGDKYIHFGDGQFKKLRGDYF